MKISQARKKEAIEGYLGIMPWLLGFLLFTTVPLIASLYLSFTYWDIVTPIKWAGLENFKGLLQDEMMLKSLWNSLRYTIITVPLTTALGLIVAVLMNNKIRGIVVFRAIFYLPSILPGVAVALLWVWILNPEFGMLNTMLGVIGIQGPMWLDDTTWAMWGVILRACWGVGGGMILFLAALQNVAQHYYEAAIIDGANSVKRFWHITLPMITPTIFYFVVMGTIGALQEFILFRVMTNGGPEYSTTTFVLNLYNVAFDQYNIGYASALAWLLFIIIMLLTIVLFKTSGWVYYEGAGDRR